MIIKNVLEWKTYSLAIFLRFWMRKLSYYVLRYFHCVALTLRLLQTFLTLSVRNFCIINSTKYLKNVSIKLKFLTLY